MTDLNAHADEPAAGPFAEFFEGLLVEINRVWVQAGDHAGNGIGDELFFINGLDIVAFDHAKNSGELLQFFEWQGRHSATRYRL